ncbi:MAG TPA: hypothetical protein VJT74_10825, partial [Pyrinomonadaceae bacterium]|nr:hypothetical protein [Pyrinomonadaceae bacterium]
MADEDPCADLEKAYHQAEKADRAADLMVDSAESALTAQEITYAGAIAAEITCGVFVETGPGFFACLAAALTAAEAAAAWIESAEDNLEAAKLNAEIAEEQMDDALERWCECV